MIPIVGRSPESMLPTVLPDLLRAVGSVCARHGVPPATGIVCLMVAAAAACRAHSLDGMTYMATAVEAWSYALKAEPAPLPEEVPNGESVQ